MNNIDNRLDSQPKDVIFCKKCVVSNQRPGIIFDKNGICGPCNWAEEKKSIDWIERGAWLKDLCDEYRRNDGRYDVVVPCSGGKDSGMVAWKLKHVYGMHPVCVTYAPFLYTDTGMANYLSLIRHGFSVVQVWPNGHLHRLLARISLEAVGDDFQPFTYGQIAVPFHISSMTFGKYPFTFNTNNQQ